MLVTQPGHVAFLKRGSRDHVGTKVGPTEPARGAEDCTPLTVGADRGAQNRLSAGEGRCAGHGSLGSELSTECTEAGLVGSMSSWIL